MPGGVITISTGRAEMLERSLNVFGGALAKQEEKEMKKFIAAYFVPVRSLRELNSYQKLLIGGMSTWEV